MDDGKHLIDSWRARNFCPYCDKPLYTIKYEDGKKICDSCKHIYPDRSEAKKYVGK